MPLRLCLGGIHISQETRRHFWLGDEINGRDGVDGMEYPQNVVYSSSRLRRDDEEVSSKWVKGRPDEKLQS